jgi:hypothetical protein
VICLHQVDEDNVRVSRMVAESNKRYKDLHTAAGNAVRVLSPPATTGMTRADRLRTVPPWVMQVAMYCICLGTALAMVTIQLQLGEDLTMVEPGFPGETS